MKKYDSAIDGLRFIAILAVIMIHTSTKNIGGVKLDIASVPYALFFNQVSRFAVPLFFMISGFVLQFSYKGDYLMFFKKRISKILIPFIIWSSVYYFIVYKKPVENFIPELYRGNGAYHLYFIPALLILYILFPLINRLYFFLSKKWMLILLGAIELYLLYADYNHIKYTTVTYYPLRVVMLNYYVFFLGMYFSENIEKILSILRKRFWFFVALVLIFASYIFMEGGILYLRTHDYRYFYSQWRPDVMIYSILFGGVAYYILNQKQKFLALMRPLSSLSFFVFFVHVIYLELIWNEAGLKTLKNLFTQFWFAPFFFLLVTVCSFATAYVAHRIPGLRKILG